MNFTPLQCLNCLPLEISTYYKSYIYIYYVSVTGHCFWKVAVPPPVSSVLGFTVCRSRQQSIVYRQLD